MERPRLKANLTTKIGAADRVFLIAEDRHVVIQGRGPVAILPYLDGHHTIAQIAEAVGDELSLPETIGAIRKFQLFGRIADGYPELPEHEIAYWDAVGVDPGEAKAALRAATIAVVIGWPAGALNSGPGVTAQLAGSLLVRSKRQTLPCRSPAYT